MTPQELKALKEQIKLELLQEMQQGRSRMAWLQVSRHIEEQVTTLGHIFSGGSESAIRTHLGSIIKLAMNLKRVEDLQFEDVPYAIKLADQVLDFVHEVREERSRQSA